MAFQHERKITVLEYDGDEHYRHSIKIKTDRAKDEAARTLGYQVVRFPYWVQLDNATVRHYFGLKAEN
jgi:very-short-patch-repair endonuclease